MSDNDLLSTRQAAKILGVNYVTVGNWCREKRIGTQVGRYWVIRRGDLSRLLRPKRGRPFKDS